MPIIRKSPTSHHKHHPYLSNRPGNDVHSGGHRDYRMVSRSMHNISRSSSGWLKSDNMPRSMSAIDENSEGWKLPFCGVLSSTENHNDNGSTYGVADSEIDHYTRPRGLSIRNGRQIPRSCSYQVGENQPVSPVSCSSPIPVPRRSGTKRKTSSRSSGGYFFDKYMKRFRAKYGSRSRKSSATESEASEDMKSEKQVIINITSNRQDMVCDENVERIFYDTIHQHDGNNELDSYHQDDLYPLRYGSSAKWDAQIATVPRSATKDSGCGTVTSSDISEIQRKDEYLTLSSVFPASPQRFWGDASFNDLDEMYAQPVSPVPSITDGAEVSCRYSDSSSETLKAMETLYLCNFKVAIEGDWLCLKEICDDAVASNALIANAVQDELAKNGIVDENAKEGNSQQMKVERRNLLGMAKLSVKSLIGSSLSAGHTLDSDHAPLQQFFVVLEYILRQGLKNPKNFFVQNKYFWPALESIEKFYPDAKEITNSVRSLPGIRTNLGRGRAWLRLAVMQKKLSDYFKVLIENKTILSEWYEDGALLMNDEATVLAGHLVGLNCIDANLCMKGDDLDNQVTVIDYSMYMMDGNRSLADDAKENEENAMQKLMDQKNYLEERNRHLETTSSELRERVEQLETENQTLHTELAATKILLEDTQSDKQRMINEKQDMTAFHQKTLEDREKDLDTERMTLRTSRAELDEMYTQIQKQLRHETQMRMDVERELELQMSLKNELEVAMRLLEKDIYDKQDGLITLREQLDNVKAINMDIYKKLQAKTELEEKKNRTIGKFEQDTKELAQQISKLQEQLNESNRQTTVAREQADRYIHQLDDNEKKRGVLLTNLQVEHEWRQALESQNEKMQQEITLLQEKVSLMESLREELQQQKLEYEDLQESCREQEMTITDLASQLGKSKQDLGDLQEVHKSVTGSVWESDKQVTTCAQCEKPFNLSRRKHHCRNCGQIYCNSCSDNTMPLASSAKPVRVCDTCHTTLLQRFSAGT
uniref:ZF(FYVE)-7 zinc finger (FYVE)-7 n=1 Tax=Phallusia mammillata TaxID=59560 RepID=A0A6F9DQV4_9ASCI|nr:ZF(FYVE)-7 zinc finger (FYVE)-7 [Phallusia mammillata]